VFGHDGAEAGIVLAIFSVGSLAGGLFLGHVPIGPWSTARRMFIVFAGMAYPLGLNVYDRRVWRILEG